MTNIARNKLNAMTSIANSTPNAIAPSPPLVILSEAKNLLPLYSRVCYIYISIMKFSFIFHQNYQNCDRK